MSTNAQVAANIENARHSTGPQTEEGKQRSSQNALKHGITSKATLIPGEDPAEYQAFCKELLDYWRPFDDGEFRQAEEMINIQWRLRRCEKIEAKILAADAPDFKALNNISLYASRLTRQYTATFKILNLMQTTRWEKQKLIMAEAETIRRADAIAKRPTNLKDFGFDFTTEEVDEEIRLKDKLEAAKRTIRTAQMHRAA